MDGHSRYGFQTEVDFTLPRGYVDASGTLHRQGVMRLATAADEILPLRDPRVQQNEAYFTIIVLARVIVRLGSLPDIDTHVVEGLYAADLSYLQALYDRINSVDAEEDGSAPTAGRGNGAAMNGGTATMGEA